MKDKPPAGTGHRYSDADGEWISIQSERSDSPEEQDSPKYNLSWAIKKLISPWIWLVNWLDQHDGAVTAVATVAIAALTYSLAHDSNRQMIAIQGQLDEMKIATTIQKNDVVARVKFELIRELVSDAWRLTPKWENIGKSNATNVYVWYGFKVAHNKEEAASINPFEPPTPNKDAFRADILEPSNPFTLHSSIITKQEAWNSLYGRDMPVFWGYLEYKDIFGDSYSTRYCEWYNFSIVDGELKQNLPRILNGECNKTTYVKNKNS